MTDICFLTHQMQAVGDGMCTEQANVLFNKKVRIRKRGAEIQCTVTGNDDN